MALYRDAAIVLRTQKLGEADRIVTLADAPARQGPRRRQGRAPHPLEVRRAARAVHGRRRPALRRALARHVTQAETLAPYGDVIARDYVALHRGHRDARDGRAADRGARAGRCSSSCCSSAACARWPAASTRPGWCSTPTCCARSPSRAGRRASTTARAAARRARTRPSTSPAGGAVCPTAARPARRAPAPQTLELLAALLAGDWALRRRERAAAPARGQRPGRRLPAVAPRAGPALAADWSETSVMSAQPCTRRAQAPPARVRPPGAVPAELRARHVAIVMDGNGRWANARGLPRTEGHKAGEAALLDVVAGRDRVGRASTSRSTRSRPRTGSARPTRCASSWASTATCIRRRRDQLNEWGVRVRWAGRRPRLWRSVIKELRSPRS